MINANQAWVLVAEDNEMNQMYIKNLLVKCGIGCHIVENGLLAVEHAMRQHYDLICMDIQMPIMDGREAIAAIQSQEGENKDTPIIVLSALTTGALMEEVMNMNIAAYITKPFKPTEFFAVIAKYIAI